MPCPYKNTFVMAILTGRSTKSVASSLDEASFTHGQAALVFVAFFFADDMPGQLEEDIFQRGTADMHGFDGDRLGELRDLNHQTRHKMICIRRFEDDLTLALGGLQLMFFGQ